MRILVTGAGGFAGRHLLSELGRGGENEIVAGTLGDEPTDAERDGIPAGVRWMPLDVTSTASVEEVVASARPEQVYHLAGQASVGASFQNPLRTWEINATGTLRVVDALRRAGSPVRLLLISSAEVYGAVPPEEQPIQEDRPLRPLTPYGASKAAAEVVALQAGLAHSFQVIIARSFNHIGPGQDERFVLPSFARQLVEIREGRSEPVLRVGNLDVDRDFLDVRDVVRAYRLMMETGTAGRAYNVASARSTSLDQLVRRLVELSGTNARIEIDEDRVRPVDIPALIGDDGPLRELGWTPAIPLDRTLTDLLAYAGRPVPG